MNLEEEVIQATSEGRDAAEAIMLDTCQIDSGEFFRGPMDPETGLYPDPEPIYSYEGKCRLKAQNTASTEIDSGNQLLVEQGLVLSLPIATSGAVAKNHTVKITAVHPTTGDPALVGREYRVEGPHGQTFATARRFRVEETS